MEELIDGLAEKLEVIKLRAPGTSRGVVVVDTGDGESSIRTESGDRDRPGFDPSLK